MTDTKPSDTPRTDALVNDKPNDWALTYAASIIELAREFERELTRIQSAEMPVEPVDVGMLRSYASLGIGWHVDVKPTQIKSVADYIDALQAYAQRKESEAKEPQ